MLDDNDRLIIIPNLPLSVNLLSATSRAVFFFQAEDGIRGIGVTGVQTCALPIFAASSRRRRRSQRWDSSCRRAASGGERGRSEERRVGKECRSRWSAYH